MKRLITLGLCVLTVATLSVQGSASATAEPAPAGREAATSPHLAWRITPTGVAARLRGLSVVSRDTAWASGSGGTVIRTEDGGVTWRNVSPPGVTGLQFRDIEAFDGRRAVILSIGEGDASRVYRTEDGGASWTQTFVNDDSRAFYDCVAFFDDRNGLAMSDPVDGRFRILSTEDGGRSWRVLPADRMPPALPGEAGFAASGQCLVAEKHGRNAWMATGGAAEARIFHTRDRGRSWTVATAPIPGGDPARGVFALAFRDGRHGIAVGGDYRPDQASPDASALSRDGGRSWSPARRHPQAYRSGVTWIPHTGVAAIAVGPTGSDLTLDGGRSWRPFDTGSFDTVSCARDLGCWASGEQGRVARLTFARTPS
ncbi:WD40/YVTN/BNR-like repeat-containing protein [Rhizohabitans arisaemae]|uniref:WD40/YVTN/BNR-like repeat-containing protein n=1 Tax=Rhizohabitans arisaemae TaxID=2720610 RepID=UPI0024B1E0BA|nr:oxidoreductase [Rhizohabitans arisaemae]